MTIEDLQQKKVAVLGFGQEGQAIAEYLINHKIAPAIYDGKDLASWKPANLAKLQHLKLTANCAEDFIDQAINQVDVIFRSPGIKISDDQYNIADKKNLLITSQTQWFFEHCPAKIIGVTGTKGKGTTASLLYKMLVKQFTGSNQIFLTGNIGKIQPLEFLEKLTEIDLVVYELSSFQLQNLLLSPQIGICLMVTSDHLDYHHDLTEYHSAKYAVSKFQNKSDVLIYNADYEATRHIAQQGQGQKLAVTKLEKLPTEFGTKIFAEQEKIDIHLQSGKGLILATQPRLLMGKHNLENIAAASTAAAILEVSSENIQQQIQTFAGLEHRLQFVSEVGGVKYYNDSVSTNPDTTIAAIKSFEQPIILIVGGAVKNLDYTNLVNEIITAEHIKAVVTMGPAGEVIKRLLLEENFDKPMSGPLYEFKQVVDSANKFVASGDIVLLSPGATSFDMFNSYAERGDQFIKLVS